MTGQFNAKTNSTQKKTLTVWVTETDLAGPSALQNFLANLQETNLTNSWSVKDYVYYDPTNALFGAQDLIAGTTWSGATGSLNVPNNADLVNHTYSVTEEFVISDYRGAASHGYSGNAAGEVTLTY